TTIYYQYYSSYLKPEAKRALEVNSKDLKANGARVVLEGNTDERGTREYNMALGERRAKAVQRYLVLQGVSPAQLELVSYGKERPVATGHDEQSWAQNRRVELRK
ncbi:peptidoglycan-associated lipoprotein Pal, partial [Pseudomonas protegens]|uniref:peptidoglycan-associated lipoprotein Pal n=1 Tax=Pseudomonas protegens TaxID=380021 RepID=UPI00381E8298